MNIIADHSIYRVVIFIFHLISFGNFLVLGQLIIITTFTVTLERGSLRLLVLR